MTSRHPTEPRKPYERYRELHPAHADSIATMVDVLVDEGHTFMSTEDFRQYMTEAGGQHRVSARLRESHLRLLLQDNGARLEDGFVVLPGGKNPFREP